MTKIIAEYIWIDGSGETLRSKCRTLFIKNNYIFLKDVPIWNFDGSSTKQAEGNDSEVLIIPVSIYKDPLRGNDNILVMCKCVLPDGTSAHGNNRNYAENIFKNRMHEDPWYGIEQEYIMFEHDNSRPLGWPINNNPEPQGPYYCGNGTSKVFGRNIVDEHYKACIYSGIDISGTNAEVMLSQWEYQIGPTSGIKAADDLWISRFLLHRIAEKYNVIISFEPKPIKGDWNGSGCHTNYSTKSMREEDNNYNKVIEKLSYKHKEHINVYGKDNENRLTGIHETSSIDTFSYGIANRGCSIRIPRDTANNGVGYIEDRRPSSNMDPYLVTAIIAETTIDEK